MADAIILMETMTRELNDSNTKGTGFGIARCVSWLILGLKLVQFS